MIGTIAGWLIARNPALTLAHAKRLAKVGLIAGAVGAAVGGFMIWDHFDDKAAVEAADSKRRLKEANRALEGERRANRGEDERRRSREADSDTTTADMKEAENADPEAARAPAGPVSRASADRLRGR
ncbi:MULTISPECIES: hypothetical protein [unclassified Erythrobacter]|uniref:hypothetical protein n=1 Tax=unclassified Erythrobacter TaxID=2633097 RepID=UPI0007B9D9F3|nr:MULTISPECIES: hypothetical protein [unclassified Erythrobacter]KZY95079.1 hypothetical protein A3745_08125 [Erythrobacter sp. HI0074]KZZ09140.1 hypothetical protein A3748_09215 [Erythrobacter sp. HI0077]